MLSLGRFRMSFLLGFLIILDNIPGCNKKSSSMNQYPSDQAENCTHSLPFHTQGIYEVTQGSLSEFEGWSHSPGRLEQYEIDFGLPGGTEILASREGVVSNVRDDNTACGGEEMANYSNYVIVDHGDGTYALYNHLQAGIVVDEDERITQGQLLGYSGNTGYSNCGPQMNKGYHLHFQLQESGDGFDTSIPIPCFKGVAGGIPNRGMILSAQDEIPFITGYVSEQATFFSG